MKDPELIAILVSILALAMLLAMLLLSKVWGGWTSF